MRAPSPRGTAYRLKAQLPEQFSICTRSHCQIIPYLLEPEEPELPEEPEPPPMEPEEPDEPPAAPEPDWDDPDVPELPLEPEL